MRKIMFGISFFPLFFGTIFGQLSTEEYSISFLRNIPDLSPNNCTWKVLPPLDMKTIEQEDREDETNGIPPRFGYKHEVNLNFDNSGEWTILLDSSKIWRLSISCPDAVSINLLYDKFWIPDESKFFVYSNDREYNIGAFTSENNKGDKDNIRGFATGLIRSDEITLEYYLPKEIEEVGIISIAYVVQGYRHVLKEDNSRNYGTSGVCQVNVNCTEGQNWQQEKDAVAMIIVDGNRYCTGSLVNTTANDNRPLFLTADHCLGGWANNNVKYDAINNPNLDHYSFYWHYESRGCANSVPVIRETVGAIVVANNNVSDFALLELEEHPARISGVTPYFLGWDRSSNAGTGGVGIHHPSGDIKKIATHNQNPQSNGNYWYIYWMQTQNGHSITEGGSSGSPLINNNHRVIGQLYGTTGGDCSNPANKNSIYGKFSVSWTGNNASVSRRRLRDWLDPSNTTTILNGKNCNLAINNRTYNTGTHTLAGCVVTISNTTIEPNTNVRIHGQQSVTLTNFTAKSGSNVRITAGIGQGRGDYSTDIDEEVSIIKSLELAVESETNEASDVDFIVYPNPNDGNFTVQIRGEIEPYTLEIFNNSGGLLGFVNCNEEVVYINRTDLNSGIYYVKITMNEEVAVKKIIVQ